ncbi:unnamed protein product [Brachionus calyciflorus]|uniref:RGS domain-containing protein n=1 Tax=Brachionus calyciflorus TaxID=104777 RepID=A0A813R992_9BILA|nr:unnamed protein product [Brachionus calyciflorus]
MAKNNDGPCFELLDSAQKFEDLLATNNLFVDYFNEFLINPSLGERVKFNFVSGDLEYLDDEGDFTQSTHMDSTHSEIKNDYRIKEILKTKYDRSLFSKPSSTAEIVKKNLEAQLKSIIKKNPTEQNQLNGNYDLNREQEILQQINKHSFKDLDLIRIESRLEPSELKDPKAAAKSKISVLKTKYSVNILKKPFSMKWLKYRRLTLFLQSELYSEFKLAMILAQFAAFNNEMSSNLEFNSEKKIMHVKVEMDDELIEMELNPFKAKNDLEKLNDYKLNDDESFIDKTHESIHLSKKFLDEKPEEKNETEYEDDFFKTASTENLDESDTIQKDNQNFYLIENDREFYKSLNDFKLKTSLITTKKFETEPNNLKPTDISKFQVNSNENITVIDSVNEMANILVRSVLNQALSDYNESNRTSQISESKVENKYRYNFSAKQEHEEIDLTEFPKKKSNSRLTYYKDFLSENNTNFTKEQFSDKNFTIEFEDEPYELTDSKHFHELYLRKLEIENFKNYLKENDAFVLYKIWIDIEKLSSLIGESEKNNYLKYLKKTYNKPNILNRLNKDYDRTNVGTRKSKYYELYAQYENNLEFWSIDHLIKTVQKKILKSLTEYWWPKYCIRMNSFQDYIRTKYPSYYTQKNLTNNKSHNLTDLDAENIEKSLRFKLNTNSNLDKRKDNQDGFKTKKKNLPKVKILENASLVFSKSSHQKFDALSTVTSNGNLISRSNALINELIGYDLDDYKTSPPVGWKRPISRATLLAKSMYENQTKNKQDTNNYNKQLKQRSKLDKDIYFEAIYRQDIAGQIFMKYLINKNKIFAINRLKCLQELINYKDLFYDDNFNQEDAKKKALDIYSKYIAVSANYSIDCPKADRLKIHHLFIENNPKTSLVSIKANSIFIPTYEDTFDAIEEFLLVTLFDDWKNFIETEENFFSHNEFENIERTINIKSKKIDELIEQGLLRMVPKSMNISNISQKKSFLDQSLSQVNQDRWFIGEMGSQSSRSQFFDLNELITDTRDFEMFKSFLESNGALNDIQCWIDIEAYTRIDPNEQQKIEEQARRLKKLYLNKKYLFSKNGPIDSETQNLILEKIGGWSVLLQDIPPNLLIVLAKKHIENKLKTEWIPKYLNSDFRSKSVFKNRTQMMDVVDDVLYLKNALPNTKEYSKIKKNRWLYSSQMIINFGKALRNSFTVKVFSKFLLFKSTPSDATPFDLEMNNNLVNNLQFLVEVQDYKDMYQKNPENERPIIQKMKHIIDCFISNRIPPKTRIDIPEQLVENILDQKDYLSPYLFLNANLIIFNALMPYWIEFNQIRSGKELELFDEFSSFKKMKDYRPNSSKRVMSASSQDESSNEDQTTKWRYNQYIKALKTQLVI